MIGDKTTANTDIHSILYLLITILFIVIMSPRIPPIATYINPSGNGPINVRNEQRIDNSEKNTGAADLFLLLIRSVSIVLSCLEDTDIINITIPVIKSPIDAGPKTNAHNKGTVEIYVLENGNAPPR